MRFFSGAWRTLLDAIFPPRCPLCDGFVATPDAPCNVPCETCAASLHPLEGDAVLGFDPPRISRCRSRFAYEGPVRDALHQFKYHERLDLLCYFGGELAAEARAFGALDLVVPVPMHARRLRARGFNQAALLARQLGKGSGLRVDLDSLARVRDVPPQVDLSRPERIENIKGAFAVCDARRACIEGKRVLLVDDVLTTGATLHECAKALLAAGAKGVSAITVARAL